MWSRDVISSKHIFWRRNADGKPVGLYLISVALAGYTDWRVPTKEELFELYSALSSIEPGKNRMIAPFKWSDCYFISSLVGRVKVPKEYQKYDGLWQDKFFSVEFETGDYGWRNIEQMRFHVTRAVRNIDEYINH